MMACTWPTPLAAWAKRGRGSIHKLPVGELEILAASTMLGADWMASASAESFASSSASGRRTSMPMAFGCCSVTARMSLASRARGQGQRPCWASVASSISTSATWLEVGSGRRTRKKKSFSFWLSVETGKLRPTRKTSPSNTSVEPDPAAPGDGLRCSPDWRRASFIQPSSSYPTVVYPTVFYPTIRSMPSRRAF